MDAPSSPAALPPPNGLESIGCVSFLNSKPLIDPLIGRPDVSIHFAVPSRLLALFESGEVSTALMSVVDYQTSTADLLLVPAGMIGCDGPTLTVRIFSRVPIEKISTLHADTDSHTSVILAQLILHQRYNINPPIAPLHAQEGIHLGISTTASPESMLLIGDKVVNASPDERLYPHQLDLGEAWKKLTGLPFVFAMWMMRQDAIARNPAAADKVAHLLASARRQGAAMTEELLNRYATEKQWPRDLARRYFTEYLRYEVTPRAREGLLQFFQRAQRLNLLPAKRTTRFLDTVGSP